MLLTENNAKRRRCPKDVSELCLASNCMAWAWRYPEEVADGHTGNEVVCTNGGPPPGDGWVLSTDPTDAEDYGEPGFDQIWRRPEEQEGYCGLIHNECPRD